MSGRLREENFPTGGSGEKTSPRAAVWGRAKRRPGSVRGLGKRLITTLNEINPKIINIPTSDGPRVLHGSACVSSFLSRVTLRCVVLSCVHHENRTGNIPRFCVSIRSPDSPPESKLASTDSLCLATDVRARNAGVFVVALDDTRCIIANLQQTRPRPCA